MIRGLLSPKRVVALVVALAVVAGLVVSSIWLDRRADRNRPMFRSLVRMQGLQWDLLRAGKPGEVIVVKHRDGTILINGHTYHVPKGVTIKVENHNGNTCILGENQFHYHSGWQCVDIHSPRPTLGGLQ